MKRTCIVGLSVLLLAAIAGPATAEKNPNGGTPIKDQPAPAAAPVNLPCCHCLGEKTKVDISTAVAGWHLTAGPLPPNSPLYIPTLVNSAWTASAPPGKWIVPASAPPGTYTYDLAIVVPDCTIPGRVVLNAQVAGDDAVKAILLGPGGGVLGATASAGYGFQLANQFPITAALTPGATYVLRMEVIQGGGGPTGLLVGGEIDMTCTDQPVKSHGDPPDRTKGGREEH